MQADKLCSKSAISKTFIYMDIFKNKIAKILTEIKMKAEEKNNNLIQNIIKNYFGGTKIILFLPDLNHENEFCGIDSYI